jgi:hypothetical protein
MSPPRSGHEADAGAAMAAGPVQGVPPIVIRSAELTPVTLSDDSERDSGTVQPPSTPELRGSSPFPGTRAPPSPTMSIPIISITSTGPMRSPQQQSPQHSPQHSPVFQQPAPRPMPPALPALGVAASAPGAADRGRSMTVESDTNLSRESSPSRRPGRTGSSPRVPPLNLTGAMFGGSPTGPSGSSVVAHAPALAVTPPPPPPAVLLESPPRRATSPSSITLSAMLGDE